MLDICALEEKTQELLDIQSLKEQNVELLDSLFEALEQKLDLCTGIPIVSVLLTIHKVTKSFFDYKMCIRLLKFYDECKIISQEDKDKFYKKNVYGREKEIGYKFICLFDRIDDDEKASLIGKLYIYCAENDYDINSFFRICRIIEKCYFGDLQYLIQWKDKETICAQNKLIPQEIVEALFKDGLLSECGFDGGGFTDDVDSGVIYALSEYGKVLLNITQ